MVNYLNGTADQFIGGELWALKPVAVYSYPGQNTPIKTIPVGGYVGKIYTYKQYNDKVYWMLEDNTFVLQETGKFNTDKLTESLLKQAAERQKEIDEKTQNRIDSNDPFGNALSHLSDSLGSFFKSIGLPVLIVGGIVVTIILIKK